MATYKKAGVDEHKAEMLVEFIKEKTRKTFQKRLKSDIGFFGGFFPVPSSRKEFLVSSCDGVGTKILVAKKFERFDTLGIDLVAMNCNDVAVCGAKPLFFLDYIAVGQLRLEREREIVKGIIKGCEIAGCVLLGGETAQMPDVYGEDDFDLAGFCVGIVNRNDVLGPSKVKEGDLLIGIGSNGLHSNGFSLVRKILLSGRRTRKNLFDYRVELGRSLGEELLRPTYIYSPLIDKMVGNKLINAAAHITGGGIPGNLSRILTEKLDAKVYVGSWNVPPIFTLVQKEGKLSEKEMFNVFNMGIGLILSVPPENKEAVFSIGEKSGFRVFEIGIICAGTGRVRLLRKR